MRHGIAILVTLVGLAGLAGCPPPPPQLSNPSRTPDTDGWGDENRGLDCRWIFDDLWADESEGLYQMPPSGTDVVGERYVGGCMNRGALYGYWTESYRVAETDQIVCSVTWNFRSTDTFVTRAPEEVDYSWNVEPETVEDDEGDVRAMVNDHGTFLCGELLGFDPTTRGMGGAEFEDDDPDAGHQGIGFQTDPPTMWRTPSADDWLADTNWDEFDRWGDRIYLKKTFELKVP